jgi:hypothetical protein
MNATKIALAIGAAASVTAGTAAAQTPLKRVRTVPSTQRALG